MAFVSGTAVSMATLLSAIQSALTSNGWTLSGNVLHKGTCYVQLRVIASVVISGQTRDYLAVKAGLGIDGSNNLTGPAGNEPVIGPLYASTSGAGHIDWTTPFNYFIHVNTSPDEVWVVVQYNGTFFQHIGFGQTPGVGNPGTGNWHFATLANRAASDGNYTYKRSDNSIGSGAGLLAIGTFGDGYNLPQPFWVGGRANGANEETAGPTSMNYSYHGMQGSDGAAAWSASGNGFNVGYNAPGAGTAASPIVQGLYNLQPNTWNNEAALIPIQLLIRRPDFKTTLQAEFKHMRMLRMDFLDTFTVIDRDPDFWRVYPVFTLNKASPAGGSNTSHSGAHGIAIRYDGP